MVYQEVRIDTAKLVPVIGELIARCGSPQKAAVYAGIGTSTMYRLVHRHHNKTNRMTAERLLRALHKRRDEDRKNGKTDRQLRDTLTRAVQIEAGREGAAKSDKQAST